MIEYIQKLTVVINTLNHVEVKGRQNLDALLGSIQMLEQVCKDMSQAEGGENNG